MVEAGIVAAGFGEGALAAAPATSAWQEVTARGNATARIHSDVVAMITTASTRRMRTAGDQLDASAVSLRMMRASAVHSSGWNRLAKCPTIRCVFRYL